jgi:tetratricopeptide (TPR) repeat protein
MNGVEEQIRQVKQDLEELAAQMAAGEIDDDTGRRLRQTYLRELETAAATADAPPPVSRSRSRMAIGALILLGGIAVTVAALGSTVGDRGSGQLQGVAAGDTFDPSEYSDETLEAVIAANADDPAVADEIPYMRFALAERYFERSDFQRAFGHYEAILAGDPPTDLFAGTMTRIAWITFVGNGEIDLALQVIDRALEAAPGSTDALYVKGRIVWCGAEDPATAVMLFDRILASTDLDPATRDQVDSERALAADGAPCP